MGERMIKVCPACRYWLRGLPATHTCPECGFRYDRNACLVTPYRVGRIVYGAASAAMFVTGVALWWCKARGVGHWIFLSVGLMGSVGTAWHLRRSNRFILVSLDELRVVDLQDQERAFPMNRIVDAKWSPISGAVTVTTREKRELIVIPHEFLGSHRRSRRLALLVRQHVAARQVGILRDDEAG